MLLVFTLENTKSASSGYTNRVVENEKRQRREEVNARSDSRELELNKRSDGSSDKGAAREKVHDRADDRVRPDSLQQRRAAGDHQQAEHQHGRGDRDHLLDSLLARADPGDMLAYRGSAVGAYAAALDDEIGVAFGAFDFGAKRHGEWIVS